jgi:hypothetical protein
VSVSERREDGEVELCATSSKRRALWASTHWHAARVRALYPAGRARQPAEKTAASVKERLSFAPNTSARCYLDSVAREDGAISAPEQRDINPFVKLGRRPTPETAA